MSLNLSVTLCPSFPHFERFFKDKRISSIRLNSAMMGTFELDKELDKLKDIIKNSSSSGLSSRFMITPLFYDIKGRQLRITEVIPNDDHLDIRLNHPIEVLTPTVVLFKAGADTALLLEVLEGGYRLKFMGGPKYNVLSGESIHIRDNSLKVGGDQFTKLELEKIHKVKNAGFTNWFLSYTESQRDVDEFRSLVGKDDIIYLKIENKNGLNYVADKFKKTENTRLVAARGDLYVEVDRPHEILTAVKLIVDKDPEAMVGSRILLSVVNDEVPSCADFHELAWLYDIGYRNMMLCDELCLKEPLLSRAVNVFDSFRENYVDKTIVHDTFKSPEKSKGLGGYITKMLGKYSGA